MSAGNQSSSRAIPTTRRVVINDAGHMPQDYSTTPGGTVFSTTPGGTRIIYDRKFLLQCRTSPLARTPPTNLPDLPGVTRPLPNNLPGVTSPLNKAPKASKQTTNHSGHSPPAEGSAGEDAQFEMDI